MVVLAVPLHVRVRRCEAHALPQIHSGQRNVMNRNELWLGTLRSRCPFWGFPIRANPLWNSSEYRTDCLLPVRGHRCAIRAVCGAADAAGPPFSYFGVLMPDRWKVES